MIDCETCVYGTETEIYGCVSETCSMEIWSVTCVLTWNETCGLTWNGSGVGESETLSEILSCSQNGCYGDSYYENDVGYETESGSRSRNDDVAACPQLDESSCH